MSQSDQISPSEPQDSFGPLLDGARNGSDEALCDLLERARPEMVSQAHDRLRRHGCDEMDTSASDVAQEAMLVVSKKIHKFDSRRACQFYGWVQRIVANITMTKVRSRTRRRVESLHSGVNVVVDSENTPSSIILHSEQEMVLKRALDSLDRSDQDLIGWFVHRQLPLAEIARRLELSEKRTKTRIKLAMNRCKAALPESIVRSGVHHESTRFF